MQNQTIEVTCTCCDAPATATFCGDEFQSLVCSKHGAFLSVPVALIEGMRAVMRERAKAIPVAAELLKAATVIRSIAGMGYDSTDKEIADEAIRIARLWRADDSHDEPLRVARAIVAASADQPATAESKRCEMCGFVGAEDPAIGCPRCAWDEMRPIEQAEPAQPSGTAMYALAALEMLYRGYVGLLETERDHIIDRGGACDPVDVMERSDPVLVKARGVMDALSRPAAPSEASP